nr:uncharacterized protein I203_06654 [Kwoniella mangroviensis CBS 8507]OCF64070.1 hypothetical protein I203_06654 [Kwoniella mangroviensis CBS 8507]
MSFHFGVDWAYMKAWMKEQLFARSAPQVQLHTRAHHTVTLSDHIAYCQALMSSNSQTQGTHSAPSDDTTGQSSVSAHSDDHSTTRPSNRFYNGTNLALQCISTVDDGPIKNLSILLLSKYRDDTCDWTDETFREKLIER